MLISLPLSGSERAWLLLRNKWAVLSRTLAMLGCMVWINGVQAAPLKIALVYEDVREAHRTFEAVLRERMVAHPDIQILPQRSQKDAELLIAIGARSAERLVDAAVPVLNVMVSRGGMATLNSRSNSSSIFLDQPFSRQLDLLRSVLPEAKSFGVLHAAPPIGLEQLKKQSAESGLILHTQAVPEPALLANRLSILLGVSDALLVLPDAEIYRPDTIRNILLATYRQRVPMIGLTQSYVRAGALCAVYSTPEQIAHQAAEVIATFAQTRKLPGKQYPKEFEVAVNRQVARSLGLTIKSAEQLRMAIGGRQ